MSDKHQSGYRVPMEYARRYNLVRSLIHWLYFARNVSIPSAALSINIRECVTICLSICLLYFYYGILSNSFSSTGVYFRTYLSKLLFGSEYLPMHTSKRVISAPTIILSASSTPQAICKACSITHFSIQSVSNTISTPRRPSPAKSCSSSIFRFPSILDDASHCIAKHERVATLLLSVALLWWPRYSNRTIEE